MVNFNATLIAQVLNFLILVFILAKFAYKPLMKIMDDRYQYQRRLQRLNKQDPRRLKMQR